MSDKVPQRVLDAVYESTAADWHQHGNGKGWVYKTAKVEELVYLHPTSIVFGNAQVCGDARVCGNALVFGGAQVSGDARVYGNAQVFGDAQVFGNAHVYGNALVFGDALVFGNALVYGNAQVSGKALVYGNAQVCGGQWATPPLYIQGSRHALTLCSHTQIAVGCHVHTIAEWQKKYKAIGKLERYTLAQITEYGEYISLVAKAAKRAIAAAKKAGVKAPSEK